MKKTLIALSFFFSSLGGYPQELEQAFKDSIDDYLAWCRKRNEKPEKTFSGTFNLRIPPELHAKLALQAKTIGVSLNTYVTEKLLRSA